MNSLKNKLKQQQRSQIKPNKVRSLLEKVKVPFLEKCPAFLPSLIKHLVDCIHKRIPLLSDPEVHFLDAQVSVLFFW